MKITHQRLIDICDTLIDISEELKNNFPAELTRKRESKMIGVARYYNMIGKKSHGKINCSKSN